MLGSNDINLPDKTEVRLGCFVICFFTILVFGLGFVLGFYLS